MLVDNILGDQRRSSGPGEYGDVSVRMALGAGLGPRRRRYGEPWINGRWWRGSWAAAGDRSGPTRDRAAALASFRRPRAQDRIASRQSPPGTAPLDSISPFGRAGTAVAIEAPPCRPQSPGRSAGRQSPCLLAYSWIGPAERLITPAMRFSSPDAAPGKHWSKTRPVSHAQR